MEMKEKNILKMVLEEFEKNFSLSYPKDARKT